ncbi:unnamed protein product [Malus baccata var. baccata]
MTIVVGSETLVCWNFTGWFRPPRRNSWDSGSGEERSSFAFLFSSDLDRKKTCGCCHFFFGLLCVVFAAPLFLAAIMPKDKGCILDLGATDHMTFDKNLFTSMTTSSRKCIATATGTTTLVLGAGTVNLTPAFPLHHCLLVPSLSHNLLSIPQVTKQLDCVVLMYPLFCLLQDIQTKEIIGRGTKRKGLYYVDDVVPGRANAVRASRTNNLHEVWLLHRRLGHASFGYLRRMLPSLFHEIKESDLHCEVCILAKSHHVSFPPSMNKRLFPFELVHSNVWGPSPVSTLSGIKWFVTFVDDCTRMTWIYVMKNKSDMGMVFRSFFQMVATQYSSVIKVFHSDNGGEYIGSELSTFLRDQGILHETTCPHTPQQNGVAERKNRHILETARALLIGASVPKRFWLEAVTYAVYVINRMPTRVVDFRTPLQVLTEFVPVVSTNTLSPRVFGCESSQQDTIENGDSESRQDTTENVSISQPSSTEPVESSRQCVAECDAECQQGIAEPVSPLQQPLATEPTTPSLSSSIVPPNMSSLNIPEVSTTDTHVTNPDNVMSIYKLSPRQNRGVPPDRFSPEGKVKYSIANYVSCSNLAPERQAWVNNMEAIQTPTRVEEAMKDPKWATAMDEEMMALHKNDTWEVTELPKGKKPVGCRWVFTIKYKADRSVDSYKARLVAKGYTQTYGVDYQETFSPVAKMNTVRVLISLAANLNWPLKQFDVKNVFLHGHLEEEVYMDFPPGYDAGGKIGVCRLRKSLYGLKQSPRDDSEEMMKLEQNLATEFEMKNLGDLKYFLGVEVARSSRGIFLSQRKYVLDLLKETGMLGCKPVDTPIVEKHYLGIYPDQELVDKGRYQRLVGRLIYLAYAVSVVSQFMHSPSVDHMAVVMRILAYLKSAPGKGMFYKNSGHLRIEGFTDVDWAGDVTDRRSTSGYFTFVGGNLVTWRSKKQNMVSRSSAGAEFRGIAHGICEVLWLRKLLDGLGFKAKEATSLYCDNKSAREIAENPVQHDRTKQVEVDRHFIKEKLEKKIVSILFLNSEEQLADILTQHMPCVVDFLVTRLSS